MALPAALAIIGTTLSVGSTAFQVAQALDARKAQRSAERAADDALAAAKRKLSIDRFAGLQIPMEGYELEQQANVASRQQALTALQESDPRALAAGVGRVEAVGTQQAEKVRQQMAKDIFELDKIKAEEAMKRDVALSSIDLAAVEGAQMAALAAEQQAASAFTGAAQTAAAAGQSMYEASDLFGKDLYAREVTRAIDAGDINEADRSKYLDYLKKMDKQAVRQGRRDNTLVSGFTNPYGYNPTTGVGTQFGNPISGLYFDPATDRGAGMPTYSGPYQAFDYENLPQ